MNEAILIVDDELKIVKQTRDYLEQSGFRVVSEFNLLAVLAQHPGQTFTRTQLLDRPHGVAYEGLDWCRPTKALFASRANLVRERRSPSSCQRMDKSAPLCHNTGQGVAAFETFCLCP